MLENVFQDLRYAARALRKNPVFTLIATVTLALGIGANTAIFSIIDVLLFRAIPVTEPGQLVRIFDGETKGNAQTGFVSLPAYERYRDQADAFSGLAAWLDRYPANVSAGKFGSERVDAGIVTGNFFQVLGTKAAYGRAFVAGDDKAGATPAVMLGYKFFKRHYPSAASALGSQVLLDGQWFTVVGVTPAGFGGVSFENLPEVWLPLSYAAQVDPLLKSQIPLQHESFSPFGVVGRLKPGITRAQAQAQLETIAERSGAGKPIPDEDGFKPWWPALVPMTDAARRHNSQLSFLLLGIVALVLLIACADVAGLTLARSETRQKEIAVRVALGGSRMRIIALHLSESMLISGLGAVLGLVFAGWETQLLIHSAPKTLELPLDRASSILDVRVLLFTAIVALASALLSTLIPALKYSRAEVALGIRSDSGRSSAIARKLSAQSALVVIQIAASVLLLISAGLLTRTLWHASQIRLGFNPEHTVFASTDLIRQGYDKNAAVTMLDPLLDSLRAQPGVEAAALGAPPLQPLMMTTVHLEGQNLNENKGQAIELSRVSSGYFNTVGIPLLSGRDFKLSDTAGAQGVTIVSELFAHKHWPNENALGKHIDHVGIHGQSFEVVGIAGETAGDDVRSELKGVVYFPIDQSYLMFPWQPDTTLLARGQGDSTQLVNAIRKAVSGVDSALPIFRVRTLQDQVAGMLGEEKFMARLLLVFAVIAVVLASAGVFGLMSYTTERATHDFGVRLALGAPRAHVLWLVLKKGLVISIIGLAAGLGAAFWLTRVLISLLFGVSPHDPLTFIAVGAAIIAMALLACYLPARRATRVDPLVALRAE